MGLREDNAVGPSGVTTMGINGLGVPLSDCWNIWGIGCFDGMEVMSLSGNAPGGYGPPGIPGLSSCLCLVMIRDSGVDGVVWCLSCDVHSVRFYTLATIDVTAVAGNMVSMTTLSHLGGGGGRMERSEWPLIVWQWAGLMAPPTSVRWHTAVLFWSGGNLYMCPVYTWWDSFETAPVTGSLLSANHRFARCGQFCSGHPLDTVCIGDGDRKRLAAAQQVWSRLPS